jgi:hypothetical protein
VTTFLYTCESDFDSAFLLTNYYLDVTQANFFNEKAHVLSSGHLKDLIEVTGESAV